MNKDLLLGTIKSKGKSVPSVLEAMKASGVDLSNSTFYKGLRDERPFKANEIKALAKAVPLSRSEVFDIFLSTEVS